MNQKDSELKNEWLDKACMYWSTEKYDLADECVPESNQALDGHSVRLPYFCLEELD